MPKLVYEGGKKDSADKLARDQTLSVRLDQKLRYLAGLAARRQRRSLSSYVEWALDDSLNRIVIWEGEEYSGGPTVQVNINAVADQLWDVEPADRFAKLALRYPYMLDYIEQIIWKLVCENGWFWKGDFVGPDEEYQWTRNETTLDFQRIRQRWDLLNQVARGEKAKAALPGWKRYKNQVDDDGEDIPF